jgi:uncharacterized membrane protein
MNTPANHGEKITSDPMFRTPSALLILVIIAMQILISICAFPFLPALVPTHWNAAGQVTSYASKWVNTLLFPLLSIGVFLLMRGLMVLGPHLGRRNTTEINTRLATIILVAVFLFELILQLCITAISLGMQIDLLLVVNLALCVLFIVIGNFLGKVRRNFWLGIRTPWTLTSELVWERTHRVGGWLFVACGLIDIPLSFVPSLRLWSFVVLIILISIFLYVYSYVCYQQNSSQDNGPLSSPFDETDRD